MLGVLKMCQDSPRAWGLKWKALVDKQMCAIAFREVHDRHGALHAANISIPKDIIKSRGKQIKSQE